MLRNYLSVAFRVFKRNKFYSLLNLTGLSIGIATTLVIVTYVQNELSYDRHHENADRIVRITEIVVDDEGKDIHSATSPTRLAYSLNGKVTGIESYVRILPWEVLISKHGESDKYKERSFVFADSTISDIFSFEPVEGDFQQSLNKPNCLIMIKSEADKLYGSSRSAIGKTLKVEDDNRALDLEITAIINDFPETSHFDLKYIASMVTLDQSMSWYNNWHWPPVYSYALTDGNIGLDDLSLAVNREMQIALPDSEKSRKYSLQSLNSIYTSSSLENEWKTNNRKEYIQIFALIGAFILLIACINYINLSTAKSLSRAKEVGVRKVMGATRARLVSQYMGESSVMVLSSFVVGFALGEWVLLALFNKIVNKNMELGYLFQWPYLGYLVCLFVMVTLLSGIIPSFVLANFSPISIFRKSGGTGKGQPILRKVLVVFQFAISAFLIAGTLIVQKQINFIQNKNLGFEKDLVVAIKLNHRQDQQNVQQLKDALLQYPLVSQAAATAQLPGIEVPYDNPIMPENSLREEGYNIYTYAADIDFADVFDFKLIAGRNFDAKSSSDKTSSVLISESAARRFGWSIEDAIDRKLDLTWYSDGAQIRNAKVIGVVQDFHFNSLHKSIDPVIIYVNNHVYYTDYLALRLSSPNLNKALQIIENEWNKFSPDRPLDYRFLSDDIENVYLSEIRAGKILSSFTLLAIFISCLGLFGLASYSADIRIKEFSVRKILGADVPTLVTLFSKEFLIMILIANLIAVPLVWITGSSWLERFAYRVNIDPGLFIIAVSVALVITLITISYQSFKVAKNNPVNVLKDE